MELLNRISLLLTFIQMKYTKLHFEPCETVTHIQCRSATAAVEERCRPCLNAQGNHFQQHLI